MARVALAPLDDACGSMLRRLDDKRRYALAFVVIYLVAWAPALAVLWWHGKSFFWQYDGLLQQYVWFVYTGQWLRELAGNVFIEHTFVIPMWEMHAGFGIDALRTVAYMAVNPFYAVSAFVAEPYAEYAFECSLVAQGLCAGLLFSLWCSGRGVDGARTLAGAVTYTFAGSTVCVFSQPGFMFALWAFPLLLWTIDRVFFRRRWGAYVAALAFCFAYSYYDSYMMALMVVGYCVANFFWRVDAGRPRKGRFLRLMKWVGAFAGLTLLALLISCVILLPQLAVLVTSSRLSLERADRVAWSLQTYANFVIGFSTTFVQIGSDAFTGFGALAGVGVFSAAVSKRRNPHVLACFVVLTVMMLVPFFGSVMNAMQYATDRWSWAYSLCVAYLVATSLDSALSLGRRARVALAVLALLFSAGCVAAGAPMRVLTELPVLLAAVLICVLASRARAGLSAALVGLIACAAVSGSMLLAWYPAERYGELADAGTLWEAHSGGSYAGLVAQVDDYDEGARLDRAGDTAVVSHNSNLITHILVPDWYNSIYNQGIDDFYSDLGLVDDEGANNRFGALSARSALDGLLGVRYFYIADGELALLPAQFQGSQPIARGRSANGSEYSLYETGRAAPLAFVAGSSLSEEAFLSLDIVDRQSALLQATVLDDEGMAAARQAGAEELGLDELSLGAADVPFTLGGAAGLAWDGAAFRVEEAGASVEVTFDAEPGAETYLVFTGMRYQGGRADSAGLAGEGGSSGLSGFVEEAKAASRATPTRACVSVYAAGARTRFFCINSADEMYGGKADFVVNLGSSLSGPVTAVLSFDTAGIYSCEGLRVVSQPVEPMLEQVDALAAAGASDIELGSNELSCTAEAPEGSLLFWSVAFSEGWTATVDGEPAEVLRADLGFMAVPVGEGTHEVVLRYQTPWLAEGACVTAAGLAATAGLAAWRGRRRARAGAFARQSRVHE